MLTTHSAVADCCGQFIGANLSERRFLSVFHATSLSAAILLASISSGFAAEPKRTSAGALPDYVDNSALPSFPPVTHQGPTGACSIFAALYYQMTHMAGLANNYNNKTSKSTVLAPNWTMNFGVGGIGCYDLVRKNGCASWEDIPFTPDPNPWNTNPRVWASALKHKVDKNGSIGNVNTKEGFLYMKELLSQGHVLYFDSWIGSLLFKKASDDPSTDKDDAFVGKNVVYGLDNYVAGHALAIVGYNDHMWVDINDNKRVDPGEKGAIKIVNSWGAAYEDKGFTYIAYDALRENSIVKGVPEKRRFGTAFNHNTAYWVTFKTDYHPRLLAQITVNTSKRNQLKVELGYSPSSEETPKHLWSSFLVNNQGGAMGIDGTENASDGNFVFDFTDLITEHNLEGTTNGRWYVKITDSTEDGNPVILKKFRIIDNITKKAINSTVEFPISVDGKSAVAWVDYSLKAPKDKTPPTVPGNIKLSDVYASTATLTWPRSRDNVAIKHYKVFRNGKEYLTTEKTTLTETNLPLGQSYVYTVRAVDTANNMSAPTKPATVKVIKSATFDTTVHYKLINKKSSKALSVAQGTYQPGVPVVQYDFANQGNQHWKFVDAKDGSYWIYTSPGNLLIQVGDASVQDGARISQWSDTGSDGCKWVMIPMGDKEYVIANKNSGKVLSVVGASDEHSAPMEQTTFKTDPTQLWQIEAVSK